MDTSKDPDQEEDEEEIDIENFTEETIEENPPLKNDVFDEDSDNPPAGTPGHPGFDEDE